MGLFQLQPSCFYLGELVGNLWGVWVFAGFLFKRNNHKILKQFPFLPLNELQLQCAVAGGPSKDGLQFQQPLGVGWGERQILAKENTINRSSVCKSVALRASAVKNMRCVGFSSTAFKTEAKLYYVSLLLIPVIQCRHVIKVNGKG